MKSSLFTIYILFSSAVGMLTAQERGANSVRSGDELFEMVSGLPTWEYNSFKSGGDRVVLKGLLELQFHSVDDVRELVLRLMNTHTSDPFSNEWYKVYIINRLFFDIPKSATRQDLPGIYGGWGGGLGVTHPVSAIWPLLISENNDLRIAARAPSYSGPAYRGLEEFEAFLKHFERRDLSKYKVRAGN